MLHTSLLTQHDARESFGYSNRSPRTIRTWPGERSTSEEIKQFSRTEVRAPEEEVVIKCEHDKEPAWFRQTAQALIALLELHENWNSYGARPIDRNIISYALQLLTDTMRDDTPPPTVVPTNRGGVQLEWHTRGIDLEVEIRSPGRISVLCEDLRSGEEWEEELTNDLTRLSKVLFELSHRRYDVGKLSA